MLWIKRNIGLLISILVAVLLTVGAVIYLLAQVKANSAFDKDLDAQKAEWARVTGLTYFPSEQNIAVAKSELNRLSLLVTNTLKQYVAAAPPKMDDLEFTTSLLTTISELQSLAQANGVGLPPRYGFSFETLRDQVRFQSNAIPSLAMQLREVRELCGILFSNRVHSVVDLKRVPVSTNDVGGGAQYLAKGITTNTWVTITPYEVTFRGFVSDLQGVMNDLQRSPVYFVVKTIDVVPVTVRRSSEPPPPPPPDPKAPPAKGATKGAAPPPPKTETIRVLDDQPLQIRMRLEVVKSTRLAAAATK